MAGGKVSSGKPKSGPPAYANRSAFRHNPSSRLTKHILSLPINDLCPTCEEQIEWRKRFRKYKPLTVAKRCVKCQEKGAIKEAYHVICRACCRKEGKCAKCLELRSLDVKKAEIRAEKENKPAESFLKSSKVETESDESEDDEAQAESEETETDEDSSKVKAEADETDVDDEEEETDLASDLEKLDLDTIDVSNQLCSECEAELDVCVCEYDSDDYECSDEYDEDFDEELDDDFDEDCDEYDETDDDDDDASH